MTTTAQNRELAKLNRLGHATSTMPTHTRNALLRAGLVREVQKPANVIGAFGRAVISTVWVEITEAGQATLASNTPGTITSTVRTTNTRPHQVRPVGQQHADDQGPMGQCTVCDTVGEWNALTDLAPNAYGCSGRPPYGH
ncbi:hypothetical protein [Streptomyces scabiei]|uniref:hypothetical protein n=1 Tax=Streptomyces scabiei TaxID=1930 RepID=UPI001FF4013D|nr:hypothetical protein [Streptomyces sp. LBUM 1483]